jgi:predicted permease
VQSAILAICSSILGALFAAWSAPYVIGTLNPADDPVRLALPADWRVLLFGVALTLFVTCLFGIIPALRASSTQPVSALKGSGDPHSRRRLMYALIAAQVAVCTLVLFSSGLFISTFHRLSQRPLGFSSDRLLVLDTLTRNPVPSVGWQQLADHLRSVPGVERVSIANNTLLEYWSNNNSISINSAPPTDILAYFRNVSPGWLETMKIPLVTGRDFLPTDVTPVATVPSANGNSPILNGAALVNETFAKTFFHDENVLGKSFSEIFPYGERANFQIVGLVKDAAYSNIRDKSLPVAYLPFQASGNKGGWWSDAGAAIIVRTAAANPLAMAQTLRQDIPQFRSEFRVSNVFAQQELIQRQTIRERLLATLASFFSVVALLLAGVGLYGVLHYSVLQRRREIAIRLAIGAQAPNIARLVTLPLFSMIVVGAIAGIAAGLFSSQYLSDLLYQVHPTDAAILAFPSLTILASAILASAPAVLRALHTDPATTLRAD